MSIGSRIKELREKNELSQVYLAEKIGVSKQTLYKYENDIITNIPSDKIEAISQVLNISPQYLMGWEKSTNEKMILNSEERNIISEYRKASEDTKNAVCLILHVERDKKKILNA